MSKVFNSDNAEGWFGFFTVGLPTILSILKFFGIIHWSWLWIWSPLIGMFALLALMLISLPILEWSDKRSTEKTKKLVDRFVAMKKEKKKRERMEKLEKLKKS